jgi:STE24 endopeptidase
VHEGRRVAAGAVVVGALAFVIIAVLLVPWDPIPGGPLHPPSASSVFTAEQIQRAEDYSGTQRLLSWASLAVSLAVACVLGFTRIGARFVDRVRGPWWWRVVVAVFALAVVGRLATLPFSILLRRRALEFGLTNQAWGAYAVDLVKGLAVGVVATSIALVVLVGVARKWPRAWPATAGVLLAGLVMLGSFVYPLLVEPLFNHFEPLPDGPLRTQVLALADQEGVQVDDVLVADASRRTTTLNAYVSGFGSSRRVVVYDNLVDDADDPEILSIVAHELGHARHDDVLTGSLLGAAGALLGVGLLGLLVGRGEGRGPQRLAAPDTAQITRWRRYRRFEDAQSARATAPCQPAPGRRRHPPRAGGHALGDPRQVPRVLALVAIATLLASPVENGISRRIETRADVASLRATHDPEAFIEVQKQLALTSLADPTPYAFSQFWFGSHPTMLQRIALAQREAS